MDERCPGVYRDDDTFYTVNAVPGTAVYGEQRRTVDGTEYRQWDAHRSKAAAALTKGLSDFPVHPDDTVLYLGASTGTTVSHIADIVQDGIVYAVEYSPQIIRDLVQVADARDNIAPILGDARKPDTYLPFAGQADVLYQDVAQQDQIAILERNAAQYLTDDGRAMIAIKAQSISSTRSADAIFTECKEQLRETFAIVDGVTLSPFHTDHLFLLLEPR